MNGNDYQKQKSLEAATDPWGVHVDRVEIKVVIIIIFSPYHDNHDHYDNRDNHDNHPPPRGDLPTSDPSAPGLHRERGKTFSNLKHFNR